MSDEGRFDEERQPPPASEVKVVDISDAPLVIPVEEKGRTVKPYDEFGMLQENAEEAGLHLDAAPSVERTFVTVPSGKRVSAIVWGTGDAEIVLLHGGAQNAHTWDTVALALERPSVAIDLPGHGRSDWREDHDYHPASMADDVADAIRQLAPRAGLLVGMSLGGLTAIAVAARHPDLVRRLAIVDVTPGVKREKAQPILDFVRGPEEFSNLDEMLERTMAFNPRRSKSSLRRGVIHNAYEDERGIWRWRYDRRRPEQVDLPETTLLWDDVSRIKAPILLVRGSLSQIVDDDDVAELRRRQPDAQVVVVEGADHSIQGDKPVELARVLEEFAGVDG